MFKTRSHHPAGALLALLLASGGAFAAPQAPAPAAAAAPAAPRKVTTVEGITEYRLANGLRVLLFPDPGKPNITVNITYMVGSRHENYGETGMAHLLEHLVFKGTPKHPNIPDELTAHGARPNGSTGTDRTNYFETFLADEKGENLRWALELEADRMVNSFISGKDLWDPQAQKGEMTVVRNEMESGENNPIGILFERVLSTAYLWHNYGKSTIGARSDVENVNIERLQAFYHTYYQPDNATLLVAGRIDEAKTLAMVSEIFGGIPRPTRKLQQTYTLDPTQDGERSVTLRRMGDVQWALAAYHTPSASDPESAAVAVLGEVLGDTPSGRLHKALVESKKATLAFVENLTWAEPNLMFLGAQVPVGASLDEARDLLIRTGEETAGQPFTAEEVGKAKQRLLTQMELAMNDPNRLGIFLSEYIALGDWRMMFLQRDRLKAVTPAEVQRAAQTYLKSSNRTLGLFIPTAKPDRAEVPAPRDVAAMVQDYKGQAAVAQGEAFDASPANIESRLHRFTAPNGMKVALLAKKTRGASVNGQIVLHFGDIKGLSGKETVAEMLTEMLMRGTVKHDRAAIAESLARLKANVQVTGGVDEVVVSVETVRENLPAVMELITEVLRQPTFPAKELELLRQETLTALEENRNEPTAIAVRAMRRHLSAYPAGHPRHVGTLEEEIAATKAVKLEDLKAFHARFLGAGTAELVLVGDFDAKETEKQVRKLLGDWKARSPFQRMPALHKDATAAHLVAETPDKANAFFMAGWNMAVQDTDPDYPALLLGNVMLGGGFLNSRLAVRIRQKEGLSYGVGSMFMAKSQDKSAMLIMQAILAPQNAGKLEAAAREEIDRMLKDGFTAEEIQNAKKGWLQSRQVSRAQDRELAGRLADNLFLGRTLTAYQTDLEKKVSELTNDQLLAALRRHVDPAKLAVSLAGDFKKAAETGK